MALKKALSYEVLNTLKRHDVVEETQGSRRIMVELFRRWVLQQQNRAYAFAISATAFAILRAYLLKLRGSRASLSPSPSKLNASTVKIISTAGGQINQGCSTKIEALLARESILPQEGSGC